MIDHFPIYGTGDLCYVAILIGTKLILNCQVHTSNVLLKKNGLLEKVLISNATAVKNVDLYLGSI